MRFKVSRSSRHSTTRRNTCPTQGAVFVPAPHPRIEGYGEWFIEVATLEALLALALAEENELVVIPPRDDEPWGLEIYDDYRE